MLKLNPPSSALLLHVQWETNFKNNIQIESTHPRWPSYSICNEKPNLKIRQIQAPYYTTEQLTFPYYTPGLLTLPYYTTGRPTLPLLHYRYWATHSPLLYYPAPPLWQVTSSDEPAIPVQVRII